MEELRRHPWIVGEENRINFGLIDKSPSKRIRDYVIARILGSGSFATVFEGKKGSQTFALKKLSINDGIELKDIN